MYAELCDTQCSTGLKGEVMDLEQRVAEMEEDLQLILRDIEVLESERTNWQLRYETALTHRVRMENRIAALKQEMGS